MYQLTHTHCHLFYWCHAIFMYPKAKTQQHTFINHVSHRKGNTFLLCTRSVFI